jgi:hypothetical protein
VCCLPFTVDTLRLMFSFCCDRCYLLANLYYSLWLCAIAHTAAALVLLVALSSVLLCLASVPCAFYKDTVLCHIFVTPSTYCKMPCLQAIDSRVEVLVQARLQQTVQDLTTVSVGACCGCRCCDAGCVRVLLYSRQWWYVCNHIWRPHTNTWICLGFI